MKEDWGLLMDFLPEGWEGMAADSGAMKGLRKDKSAEHLLRVLLLHPGCGHSLSETVVRARQSGLAELSAVALMKRLVKAGPWLRALCQALFAEQGLLRHPSRQSLEMRLVDATTVKEPGKTGSSWRIHYSVCVPSLLCDHFVLTETEGTGTGESFTRFPVAAGDCLIGDRGYSTAKGIAHVADAGGYVLVRVNTGSLPLRASDGRGFNLLQKVQCLQHPHSVSAWPVRTDPKNGSGSVEGRVCAIRKSDTAIALAEKKLRDTAVSKGKALKPETLEFARHVIVFTTFPTSEFPPVQVLQWYRIRWQVELVFKRFKSIAQLGHLPKYNPESAKAWLYGKPFAALLTERLIHHAVAISPWGYEFRQMQHPGPVAGIPIHVPSGLSNP